jgi:hypothetical protein
VVAIVTLTLSGKGGIARVVHDQDDPAPDRKGPVSSDRAAERPCHHPGLSGSDDRPNAGQAELVKWLRTGRGLSGIATLPSRSRQEAHHGVQVAGSSQVADDAPNPS